MREVDIPQGRGRPSAARVVQGELRVERCDTRDGGSAAQRSPTCSRTRCSRPGERSSPMSISPSRSPAPAGNSRHRSPRELINLVGLHGFEDSLPGGSLRWHASARRHRPGPHPGAVGAADGRTLRRADELTRDRMHDELLAIWQTTTASRDARDPLDPRGRLPGGPRRDPVVPAGPHRRRRAASTSRGHVSPC